MSSMIKHKGALYVEADGVEGFSEDLNHFVTTCLPQIDALLGRAKRLKLKKVGVDLTALRNAITAFEKREPPDLQQDKTQEMAANTK